MLPVVFRQNCSHSCRGTLPLFLPGHVGGTRYEPSHCHHSLRPHPCRMRRGAGLDAEFRAPPRSTRLHHDAIRIRAGRRRGEDIARSGLPDAMLDVGSRIRIHRYVHAAGLPAADRSGARDATGPDRSLGRGPVSPPRTKSSLCGIGRRTAAANPPTRDHSSAAEARSGSPADAGGFTSRAGCCGSGSDSDAGACTGTGVTLASGSTVT
jgi:hypothetical protein